ncbi:MAG: cyclase family protein [Bacteroidales bacterium]|nr:cyclase family protein [Bacteroidales bacterium]
MPAIIDLSYNIDPAMPVYPGSDEPTIEIVSSIEQDGYKETRISVWSHIGTHIESQSHIIKEGKTLDQFNIDQFIGSAIVISCNNLQYIEADLLPESLNKQKCPDFILFYTGWDKYWGTKRYFDNYPVLTLGVSKLLSSLPLKGIGIDTISVDPIDSKEYPVHKILLNNDKVIIENLCNLDKLPRSEFSFSCVPLKISNSEASPVRAYAII